MYTHETSIYHALIIIALSVGTILVYVFYSMFRQRGKYLHRQRMYFSGDINLLEKERARVADDLHDDAGLLISLIKAHVNEVDAVSDRDLFHIEKANEQLDELMKRLKGIAANLSSKSLMRKGLGYTLKNLFEGTQQLFGIAIEFIYEVESEIGTEERIHLFRIVQEITHNTVKHARAHRLLVHFKEKDRKLYLLCKDDGTGFDTEKAESEREGMGLGNLKSRTAVLRGEITCTSNAQNGTEYFFAFPFEGSRKGN